MSTNVENFGQHSGHQQVIWLPNQSTTPKFWTPFLTSQKQSSEKIDWHAMHSTLKLRGMKETRPENLNLPDPDDVSGSTAKPRVFRCYPMTD